MPTVTLPTPDGGRRVHTLREPTAWSVLDAPPSSRIVYTAAHVVADPLSDTAPGAPAVLDWDATLRFRHHLWDLGLGVADAMDTAQRNFGLTWDTTAELIRRVGSEARSRHAALACGVATDHVEPPLVSLDEVCTAYLEQLEVVEDAGAVPVIMASRHLARVARGPDDYRHVYGRVLAHATGPVMLHWLGGAFDSQLQGYWGSDDLDQSTSVVLDIIAENAGKVAGLKLSLLVAEREVAMRSQLPEGCSMYCGDDYSYPRLILGDRQGHSNALLGIFDAIAPAASAALHALDDGRNADFLRIMESTVPLSRHIFGPPTQYYKAGLTFLAWLSGHQDAYVMLSGMAAARSVGHLVQTFLLADDLGLLPDPDRAAHLLGAYLTVAGMSS